MYHTQGSGSTDWEIGSRLYAMSSNIRAPVSDVGYPPCRWGMTLNRRGAARPLVDLS